MRSQRGSMSEQAHLILFYKGDISALTLFCRWPDGGICFPPLPKLSTPIEAGDQQPGVHTLLPKALLANINQTLGLDDDLLEIDHGFFQQVEQPDGIKTVYLARFKVLDPPYAMLEKHGCQLLPLTGLIGGAPAEMALLQQAYSWLMES